MSERILLSEAEQLALWRARRRTGLRVKVLARELGVSPGAVMKYQWGERPVPVALLEIWKAALRLPAA